jgi:hypothetical protein
MQVSFKTAKGAQITIEIVTERANLADHTFTERCWELRAEVNGRAVHFVERIEHPLAGAAVKLGDAIAPIPAETLGEVDTLFAAYNAGAAEIARQADAIVLERTEYEQRRSRVISALSR